jgi:hypothetical protein
MAVRNTAGRERPVQIPLSGVKKEMFPVRGVLGPGGG